MTYLALMGIRFLAFSENNGPFDGIGIDRALILTVGAMPTNVIGIVAGFRFGRIGDVSVTAAAAITYFLVALGIWRRTKVAVAFGLLLACVELLILMVCIWFTLSTSLLPEFHKFALAVGFAFVVLYGFSAVYFSRRVFGKRFDGTHSIGATASTH